MTLEDAADDGSDAEATAAVETGRRGQWLICEGWFASHADSGTPGAHVHLRSSDGQDPVVRTDQVPALVEALSVVAQRIDGLWAEQGAEYAERVVRRAPDPQDPAVVRQAHVDHLQDHSARVRTSRRAARSAVASPGESGHASTRGVAHSAQCATMA